MDGPTPSYHYTKIDALTIPDPDVANGYSISLPANTILKDSVVHIDGLKSDENNTFHRNAIQVVGDNVQILDSLFYGDNDPWDGQYVQNNCGAIVIPISAVLANILIRGCTFRNLYGHPVHGGGAYGSHDITIEDCLFLECSNGPNVNTTFRATYRRCTLTDAESTESSENDLLVEYCDFTRSYLAIGGNQGGLRSGQRAHHCTFAGNGTQSAVILTDNTSGAVLEDMTIDNYDVGLNLGGQSGLPVLDAAIRGFQIANCRIGIYSSLSPIEAVLTDGLVSGHLRGAEFAVGNIELRNYTFTGNGTDLYIRNTVDHVLISNCTYDTIYMEAGANVTIE